MEIGGLKVELSEDKEERLLKNDVQSQAITLGVRPEHTDVSDKGIAARVDVSEMMGSSVHLHVNIGDTVHFTFDGKVAHVFSKETDKNLEF